MTDRLRAARSRWAGNPAALYGITVLSVALALAVTLLLGSLMQATPLQLFFLAVMVSGWYGGWQQGLVATALSALVVKYFLIEPYYSLEITSSGVVFRLSTFILASVIVSWLNQSRQTAQSKAERAFKALRESEARFGCLAESNIIGMIVSDLKGLILEANNAFLKIVGYTQQDLRSSRLRWSDMTPPEYLPITEQSLQELRSTGVCPPFEKEYIRKDGSRVPILIGSVMKEETAIGFVLDLSERKQIEAAKMEAAQREQALHAEIQTARDRLENVLTCINDPFVVLDQDWCYLYINDRFAELAGQPKANLLGRCIWDLFPDTVGSQLYTEAYRAFADQTQRHHEYFYAPWQRWFENHIYPSAQGVAILATDITERKRIEDDRRRAEAELRESEARFRNMADTAPVLIWMSGVDKLCNYFNQPWLDFTGRTVEQEMGNGWSEGLHPDDRQRCLDTYFAAFDTRQPFQLEYRFRRFDGIYRWIVDVAVPRFTSEGDFLGYIGSCIDIEDRKQAEGALRESEERFRTLADNISQLAWMTNASGWIFWYNQRWFDYTGTTLEETQGWGWQQVHHPDHVDRVVESFHRSITTGEPWEDTFPLRSKDGTYRWFLSQARPIRDESGRILRWFGTNTDITDRKQAEEALRDSESRFRLIVESAKEYAILTMDMEARITQWNAGAERLLGYCEAEIVGQKGHLIFTPEDKARGVADQELQTAWQMGEAKDERWHQRKDGSRFWASGLMMPLLNEAGQIQGFMKILRDMTAEKQASERLQLLYETASNLLSTEQPLALMNSLFDKVSSLMDVQVYFNFLVDERDGRPMLRLESFGGISEEAAETIRWLEFGQGMCGFAAQEQRQIVIHDVPNSSEPNAHILGAFDLLAYAGQPLIAQGKLLGVLSFASRTRTHFTQAEADLLQAASDQMAVAMERANLMQSLRQQAEQLSQANRIKDDFLAVLSHELRTPLNPILGWSKLLRSKKLNEATVNRALETIERNAQLQTQLIEDLLDVSRILQGKLSLNVSLVDLEFIIQAAMETVQLAAEVKSIQIQTLIAPDVGQVLGDSSRLQQVIWNLLSNAVKFTPNGGRVDVRLERYDNQVQVIVSDTGKGISPEFLPYVFDYFRQADSATTRKFGGLGLGLAIVRKIVELHGGRVFVESLGEGQGATFTVTLPHSSRPEQRNHSNQTPPLSAPSSLAGLRVLVVDDEADSREFIAFVLEQEQAEVIALASALKAVQTIEQYKPDVLLSDIGMPDMDGYMLMRQVRALPPEQGGRIAAIALTAYVGELDQQQALTAGFQIHLSKPIDPEQLVLAIAQVTGRRRVSS
ncbi:MAG: PAS domain S-box protein [Oscillatoriophycideae cyanobacterium NC_groundwater_1537_Pr4_S-0.65um_50_18]|nr:PAS domain S-box protein [Oscillatoriophycideae cyanobacterium NC_groundwater_1537_Pr4_S-0.65um_50_18]